MRVTLSIAAVWILSSVVLAGGFASNDNFVVRTSTETSDEAGHAFAQEVAKRASELRQQIAKEWIGNQLPSGIGRTYLTVLVTDSDRGGRTWPKNKITGEYHNVHLNTTRQGALGGTLAHEIAHVVLETRFQSPDRIPAWVAEGIASRYDDKARANQRQEILDWYARTGNWPELKPILGYEVVPAREKATYAVSVSLCDFLLTRGDRRELLEFAVEGGARGWDQALEKCYKIRDVNQLQELWVAWAKAQKTGVQE